MKKKLLFLICILIYTISHSQHLKVDLIFNDGQVLEGFGMVTKNGKIKFRISTEDEPDTWTFLMVKGVTFYHYEKVINFEYIKTNKRQKPLLLEVVSYGKVNLYIKSKKPVYIEIKNLNLNLNNNISVNPFFILSLLENNETLYVKRENEEIATKLSGRFRKKSLLYFKDCPEVIEIFSTKEYLKYKIIDIVNEYNFYCSND
ncbi:hypothetical protein OD91_0454 [Lutibacter sp. Hel_I_33_5]|uniref:hypothetical protein n=1 Tax=Lutibacter sp. Hel_I_33_5 TaxID=1566289 RepID=UPI00119E14CF|nr:hypothetical protein [Lutibacter sp. Hel_I_33_5]TVZ55209.1 hypothetical protein OD91_0454 [Lutibacter sp. Hel_I_33_5]